MKLQHKKFQQKQTLSQFFFRKSDVKFFAPNLKKGNQPYVLNHRQQYYVLTFAPILLYFPKLSQ